MNSPSRFWKDICNNGLETIHCMHNYQYPGTSPINVFCILILKIKFYDDASMKG